MKDKPYKMQSIRKHNLPYLSRYKYISVYAATREYGGSEEGGWWYDWLTFVAIFPIPRTLRKKRNWRKLNRFYREIQFRFIQIQTGNISSVLGGTELSVHLETYPREDESKHYPHYE